jgi:hypothetical protein
MPKVVSQEIKCSILKRYENMKQDSDSTDSGMMEEDQSKLSIKYCFKNQREVRLVYDCKFESIILVCAFTLTFSLENDILYCNKVMANPHAFRK